MYSLPPNNIEQELSVEELKQEIKDIKKNSTGSTSKGT